MTTFPDSKNWFNKQSKRNIFNVDYNINIMFIAYMFGMRIEPNVRCRMLSSHFSMHHSFSTTAIQIFQHYHFCWAIVCMAWHSTTHTDNEKCLFGLKSVAIVCHSKTLSCEKHRQRAIFTTL